MDKHVKWDLPHERLIEPRELPPVSMSARDELKPHSIRSSESPRHRCHVKNANAASGLRWRIVGNTRPVKGTELDNPKLAEALTSKSIFTKGMWGKFGIKRLRPNHFIKAGAFYFRPDDTTSVPAHADEHNRIYNSALLGNKVLSSLPAADDICTSCGSKVPPSAERCGECGVLTPWMDRCVHCGGQLNPLRGFQRCPHCNGFRHWDVVPTLEQRAVSREEARRRQQEQEERQRRALEAAEDAERASRALEAKKKKRSTLFPSFLVAPRWWC